MSKGMIVFPTTDGYPVGTFKFDLVPGKNVVVLGVKPEAGQFRAHYVDDAGLAQVNTVVDSMLPPAHEFGEGGVMQFMTNMLILIEDDAA